MCCIVRAWKKNTPTAKRQIFWLGRFCNNDVLEGTSMKEYGCKWMQLMGHIRVVVVEVQHWSARLLCHMSFIVSHSWSRCLWLCSQRGDKLLYVFLKTHKLVDTRVETNTNRHTGATQNSAGVRVTVMDAIPEWPWVLKAWRLVKTISHVRLHHLEVNYSCVCGNFQR